MKNTNAFLITIFIVACTTTVAAQQWCTQEFKPVHSYDVRNSPDYGKEFSFYVFDQTKTKGSKDLYFTNIFKVSFLYYGRGTSSLNIFNIHVYDHFNNFIKKNIDKDWSPLRGGSIYGSVSRMKYCMNYDDLKIQLAKEKEKAKKRGWNVQVLDQFTPVNQQIKEGPRGAPSQNISFNVVR